MQLTLMQSAVMLALHESATRASSTGDVQPYYTRENLRAQESTCIAEKRAAGSPSPLMCSTGVHGRMCVPGLPC